MVRVEKDIDPTQYTVTDTLDIEHPVRYADRKEAEQVCKILNDNLE